MIDQKRTRHFRPRKVEPPPVHQVIWYRADEDKPATSGAVLNEYGHRVYSDWGGNYGKWYALGTDGGYYEINAPIWWCYIPEPPPLF